EFRRVLFRSRRPLRPQPGALTRRPGRRPGGSGRGRPRPREGRGGRGRSGARGQVLLARASSRSAEPLNTLRSVLPPMPGTEPLSVYCQKVCTPNPAGMVGRSALVQLATHSGLVEAKAPLPPAQSFHQPALV